MPDLDLFQFFRSTLVIFLTVYSVLVLSTGVWRVVGLFRGAEQSKQMLRLYVSYQMLTIQLKPLRGELTQIAFWLAVLAGLSWLHTLI